ncbi:MFS transporter [Nocardia sp. NPDC003482]
MFHASLLRIPAVRTWASATIGTRLAVTTVPLGSVLFAVAHTGSYAIGGLLAGGYAAGEAVLAPVMGRRVQSAPLRREVAAAVVAEAALIVVTVLLVALTSWWPLAVLAMAGAGGVAAGVPGALRSYVSRVVGPEHRDRALSIDTMINQASWLTGPAFAAIAATALGTPAPLLIIAAVLVLALIPVARLRDAPVRRDAAADAPHSARALALLLVVPILASATIMFVMAALDVLLPALLAERRAPTVLSGITLAVLAAVSIVCSGVYGARKWPGTASAHSQGAIVAMGVLMIVVGIATPLWISLTVCVLIGAAQAPALIGRNIALTRDLPEAQWPVGFSLLYSAGGVGYTLGSTVAGQILEYGSVTTAFAGLGALAVLVVAASSVPVRSRADRTAETTGATPSSGHH